MQIAWKQFGTLTLVAAFMVGCTGGGGGAPSTGSGSAGEPDAAASDVALEFELPDLDGATFRLADTAGTVRLIDFWATWCAPCREEVPMLQALQDEFGPEGFQLIAISDEDLEDVAAFVEEKEVRYLNLLDEGGDVATEYNVLGLPTAYLVDREGKIVETFLGEKPERILRQEIGALLGAPVEQAALR